MEGAFRAIECRLAQMNVFSHYCLTFSANDCVFSLNAHDPVLGFKKHDIVCTLLQLLIVGPLCKGFFECWGRKLRFAGRCRCGEVVVVGRFE